jgi:hypothetical protein
MIVVFFGTVNDSGHITLGDIAALNYVRTRLLWRELELEELHKNIQEGRELQTLIIHVLEES